MRAPFTQGLLALRAAFFFFLVPGTVAGYVPFRIIQATGRLNSTPLSLSSLAASVVGALGLAVLVKCVWDFFRAGRGTLAPIDPPQVLVVTGLYRVTRNPMYNGVVSLLLGEAWLFRSLLLAQYTLGVLVVFHLFVVLYEERTLETRFGAAYRAYCRAVPRWGFTLHPFSKASGGTA